ncbi:hypothetical protein Acsp01_26160 [Actinoplanes sp. NBRC 101535]|nr:hypothetical protein Acsp01_26160 [Actinoplanes sp. NBRC 101535]
MSGDPYGNHVSTMAGRRIGTARRQKILDVLRGGTVGRALEVAAVHSSGPQTMTRGIPVARSYSRAYEAKRI